MSDKGRPSEANMITSWYIAAEPGEKWRTVSNLFGNWLDANASLHSFGFSEGGALEYDGVTFLSFVFPEQHGENILLFPKWAEASGRVYGRAENGWVLLSNGEDLALPLEQVRPVPHWLR